MSETDIIVAVMVSVTLGLAAIFWWDA